MGPRQQNYVGSAAQSMRGVLKLQYPLEHGVITDWKDMELVSLSLCASRHKPLCKIPKTGGGAGEETFFLLKGSIRKGHQQCYPLNLNFKRSFYILCYFVSFSTSVVEKCYTYVLKHLFN